MRIKKNIQSKHKWALKKDNQSRHYLSSFFVCAYQYRFLKKVCLALVVKLEGGRIFSKTFRDILYQYYQVQIGAYSYLSNFNFGTLPKGTVVGAYCSIADGLKIYRRNHILDSLSQHAFFYNRALGLVDEDKIHAIEDNPLIIGNDVWIADGVTILPGCKVIGDGAVIGAGAVVTKDVPAFTIIGGNPAKQIKLRYTAEIKSLIIESQWWNMPLHQLLIAEDLLFMPLDEDELVQFIKKIDK